MLEQRIDELVAERLAYVVKELLGGKADVAAPVDLDETLLYCPRLRSGQDPQVDKSSAHGDAGRVAKVAEARRRSRRIARQPHSREQDPRSIAQDGSETLDRIA